DQLVAGRLIDDVIGLTRKVKGETSNKLLKAYKNKANFLAKQKKMRELLTFFTTLQKDIEARHGTDHTFTIQLLANFAKLYRDTRNYELSERIYRQVIKRSAKRLGDNHRFTVANITLLADVLHSQGKNEEAVVQYANGLGRWDRVFGRKNTGNIQLYLRYGLSLRRIGRFAEAETAYWQSLKIGERALGQRNKLNHRPYLYLAGLRRELGQYEDSEKFYKEALDRARKVYGEKHSQVALTMENLAVLYGDMGRHEDSGKFATRALELFEANYGVNSPTLVNVLNNLAMVFHATNRSDNALQYLTRAINIVNGNQAMRNDPVVPILLDNLASVFSRRGKPKTALKHTRNAYERFLELYGLDNARTATAALNLGALHSELKQFDKALPRYQQALKSFENIYGRKHRSFGNGLSGVGRALTGMGRFQEAMQYQQRALSVYETVLPDGHPQVIYQLRAIAELLVKLEKFWDAFRTYQKATKFIEARLSEGRSSSDAIPVYKGIISISDRLRQGDVPRDKLLAVTFRAAQRLGGAKVAGALAKMSARFATGENALGAAVREQQDLLGRLEVVDASLATALGNSESERNQARVVQLRDERSKLRQGLVGLEERLRKHFPRYAELSRPQPLTMERLRKQLRSDETYIQYVVNEAGVFVWMVDVKDALWKRLNVSRGQLRKLVGTLRCGLDASLWKDIKCFDLTGQAPSGPDGSVLPFDLHAAHALYSKLLGQFSNRIRRRHLLIVAPDVLAALPFHVLVRRRPSERFVKNPLDLREISWLVKSNPITILPAASSLGALRTYAGRSAAGLPYFGVGDPVLAGNNSCPQVVVPQSCERAPPVNKDVQIALAGSIDSFYRSGAAGDVNVSQLCPLP
ncbi:MAG: tetratricopeptide repeat protein, partial [Pseudomonadota bacterium]